jgi:prepilin peptidase CpaA
MQTLPVAAAWLACAILVEAALIDGWKLKVPNWLTAHFAVGGLALAFWLGGWPGLGWSAVGLAVGLVLLMPLHMIGGMGAGDVKLLAGLGAWIGAQHVLGAFAASAAVGALIGVGMALASGRWVHHWVQARQIASDIVTIRSPGILAAQAAERKPTMLLLPYGIPIAIGSIGYMAWAGLLG